MPAIPALKSLRQEDGLELDVSPDYTVRHCLKTQNRTKLACNL